MSDKPFKQAEEHHGWWPGWIWSLPIAALGLVIWLAVRSWTQTGPEIQVVFPEIANLKAGDTKVQFESMDVGEVEDAHLEPDLKHLRATLRLRPDMRGHLGPGTQFWIIGKDMSLSHLSNLKSIITGESIGISPRSGHQQDEYQGVVQPPVLDFDAQGRSFKLHAGTLGSVQRGTPLYYLGQQVGKVVDYSMTNASGFDITVFVDAPYDRLVHQASRFWRAGPLHLSSGGNGPSVQFQSVPALFEGAIAFETPSGEAKEAGGADEFTLYGSKDAAENAPDEQSVAYRMVFHSVSGVPGTGAPVKLMGQRIGSVSATALQYDQQSGHLSVLVTAMLEPRGIVLADGASWNDVRTQMDDMLRHLIAGGMRAELSTSPPVIGGEQITLDVAGGEPGNLGAGPVPEIPTVDGGGNVAGIMTSVNDVLTKVKQMPLSEIGSNLRDISHRAALFAHSPQLAATLRQVDGATANLDRMTREMRSQLPPTLAEFRRTVGEAQASLAAARKLLSAQQTTESAPGTEGLPETLYEISRTARSLRGLSDLLDQHPSALLTGQAGQ